MRTYNKELTLQVATRQLN